MIGDVLTWLNDPAHWRDTAVDKGIATQLQTHITFTLIALAIALAIVGDEARTLSEQFTTPRST